MLDLTSLLTTGAAFFVVAVSPGPANVSNATIAMARGRKISLIYGAGLSFGLVFWGLIAASGMGAILQGSVYLLVALKIFGGIYLLWLAFLSGRSAFRPDTGNAREVKDGKWFYRGLLLNMSNPKSVIAWMAALSFGLHPDDGIAAVVATTAVCIAVGFMNNVLYSVLFSMDGMMKGYRRLRRWIDGTVCALFAIAGVGLIRSAVSR